MPRASTKSLFFILFCHLSNVAIADPWFTGPILAPAGHTIPRGHSNLEIYGAETNIIGAYNNAGDRVGAPSRTTLTAAPLFTHGLTDKIDLQFSIPYAYNHAMQKVGHHIGDAGVTLGYQAMEQKDSYWRPDLRVTLQEVVPTGKFEMLDPASKGATATGGGGYQTALNLNFQLLQQLNEVHYLRTRLSLGYVYGSKVHIHGVTPYGSGDFAYGKLKPGTYISADLAGELTLTQNWVAVMELFVNRRQATEFHGFPGFTPTGMLATVGNGISNRITLAPALEYNYNANVGVIGGAWLSVAGRNSNQFITPVVALNAYW